MRSKTVKTFVELDVFLTSWQWKATALH